jgi:AbrB family looped-hinge helix DNA binding protein
MGKSKKKDTIKKDDKNHANITNPFDIAVTKMSSKGQIVIPAEMRQGIKEGDKLVIIKNKDQLIIKKAKDMDKNLEEDLEFARRTEAAYKRYEQGKFTTSSVEEFLKEMKKW